MRDEEPEYVEIDVETVQETDKAVRFSDGDNRFWVPKSVMEEWPETGESGTALVAQWFAEKEGLV